MDAWVRWMGVAWLAAAAGCGSATLVKRDAGGGQFKLNGSYGFAMGDAREQAFEHCGGRFEQQEQARTVTYRCLEADAIATDPGDSTRLVRAE
ncbi:MAG: hypothetical protein OXT09_02025 [Myxococcales bacterium]|nr:hypothetical protein [Myxococcales bacterium]